MSHSLLTRTAAKIEIHTSIKVRGLVAGRGRSLTKGSGEDFDDLKVYQAGDRLSDIDWKATARSSEPLIRQFNEERVRHLGVIADTSAPMAAHAADGTLKSDALITAAGLLCYLAHQHSDRVSLVAGGPQQPLHLPGRSSRGHLELVLRTIHQATTVRSGRPQRDWLISRAARLTRTPTLFLLITDETGPEPGTMPELRMLLTRHELMVVRIKDADPLARHHPEREVTTLEMRRDILGHTRRSRHVQRDVDAYRQSRCDAATAVMDGLGVQHTLVDGDDTVVEHMIAMLRRRGELRARR